MLGLIWLVLLCAGNELLIRFRHFQTWAHHYLCPVCMKSRRDIRYAIMLWQHAQFIDALNDPEPIVWHN